MEQFKGHPGHKLEDGEVEIGWRAETEDGLRAIKRQSRKTEVPGHWNRAPETCQICVVKRLRHLRPRSSYPGHCQGSWHRLLHL